MGLDCRFLGKKGQFNLSRIEAFRRLAGDQRQREPTATCSGWSFSMKSTSMPPS